MAILLIMDRDKSNAISAKDAACYKRGDIVEVFDDSKPCVIPPAEPFYIVKITGLTKAQALKYMAEWRDINGIMLRRRRFTIDSAKMSTNTRNKLITDRYIEITSTLLGNILLNKETSVYGL